MGEAAARTTPRLGIVIPTLDEETSLPLLLADLRTFPFPTEVIVSDGGSIDRTTELAGASGAQVVRGSSGRARQMNAGARATDAPWLLFLHADSRVPSEAVAALGSWLARPHPCGAAHFAFRLDRRGPGWAFIEKGQRLRERFTGLAYGDQGLLLSRDRFEAIGGIPELPLMEDVEAVRRLRAGGGLHRIDAPIVTSARRYLEEGRLFGSLRNTAVLSLYFLGVPPRTLARWYRPRCGSAEASLPRDRRHRVPGHR